MFARPSQDRIGPRIHGERTRAYKQSSIRCTNCFTADKYTSGHSLGIDIAVELISKTLIDEKFVSVIDCTEPGAASLARAWPGIRYTVFQTLETFASTKGYTTAISLLRLGYDRVPSYNPRTVYITLDYSSSGYGWPPVLRQLQKYVDTFNMGLVVHMEHNLVDGMSELPVPQSDLSSLERDLVQEKHGAGSLDPYSKEVKLGDAIGAATYLTRIDEKLCNPQIGTLGCWVEVKLRGKDRWLKMGLSCYHILRSCLPGFPVGTQVVKVDGSDVIRDCSNHPLPNTPCWKADMEGLSPSDRRAFENVEHPPRLMHNIAVTDLEEATTKSRDRNEQSERAVWENELRETTRFYNEGMQVFGTPCFASGYLRRSATGGRLDWSLIQPNDDNRVAGNPLPSWKPLSDKGFRRMGLPLEGAGEDSTLKSQGDSIHDHVQEGSDTCSNTKPDTCSYEELVGYKQGAATGPTVGMLSLGKTYCRTPGQPGRYSTEYIFCGAPAYPTRSFAEQWGDAGAVVYDRKGGILGLVVSGQVPQQSKQGYTIVTPIEDIFEDIKTMSKGEVEAIRVLGSA